MATRKSKEVEDVDNADSEKLTDEDLENLDNIEDLEDDEFEDTPESRGDVVDEADDSDGDEEESEEDDPDDEEDDPDDEEDESDDEDVEEEDLEAAKTDDDPRIPKKRFDYVNERRKQAERELEELRKKDSQSEKQKDRLGEINNRLAELDGELTQAMVEGDDKKIRALRKEERQLSDEVMNVRLETTAQQIKQQARYDAIVEQMEAQYPALNPEHDDYDEDAVSDVLDLRDAFQAKGETPAAALLKAIRWAMPEESAEPEKPSLRREEGKKKKPARSTKTPKKRNAKVRDSQPPSTAGRSSKETKDVIDVMNMSEEEFDKLPEKTLAKLGGDYIGDD